MIRKPFFLAFFIVLYIFSQDIFATEHHNFYKIGQYCNKLLFPILEKQNNFNPLNNENV